MEWRMVFRRCPFDAAEAERLVRNLKGAPLLLGARGRPVADIPALARTLSRLLLSAVHVAGQVIGQSIGISNAFVFGIPSDYAQQIVDGVSKSMFGPFFDQVNVKNLKVTNDGVDFAVDGDNLTLTSSATGGNCIAHLVSPTQSHDDGCGHQVNHAPALLSDPIFAA